jgi:protein TonB
MPQGGFLEQKPKSPGGLALVIALHAAVLTALMLAKNEYVRITEPPIVVTPIPTRPSRRRSPSPSPTAGAQAEIRNPLCAARSAGAAARRRRARRANGRRRSLRFRPIGTDEPKAADPVPLPLPTPQPVPDPVRVEARLDPRSELQPPYPASEQRAENEGSVTVRITIGPDGRVKQVEKVKATSDAFFKATEQQALRHWRYKPATLDGRPVESRTSVTVRFRLDD